VPKEKQKQNDYRLKSPERLVCDGTLMRNVSALGVWGKKTKRKKKEKKKRRGRKRGSSKQCLCSRVKTNI